MLRHVMRLSTSTTLAERRKQVLDLIATALALVALALLMVVTFLFILPGSPLDPVDYLRISRTGIGAMLISGLVVVLNRRVKGSIVGMLFVVLFVILISLADIPEEVTQGRTLFILAIPIITAAVMLPPRMAFVAAGLCSTSIALIDIAMGNIPNLPGMAGFFAIAVVTWIWGRSLENTMDALRKSEDQYRLLAERAKDVIVATDMNLRISYASHSIERVLGWPPQDVVGRSVAEFLTKDSLGLAWNALVEAVTLDSEVGKDGYESPPLEIELVRRDGSKLWAEMSRGFLRDEKGKPAGVVGVLRDITERRMAKRDLERAVARAEFYTDLMAHDLSNMHQAIMASLELMREAGELPSYVDKMVESALNQTEQCALLVSKVRMHSRIVRDRRPLVKMDPFPPLRAAMELVKNSFPDREIAFSVSLTEGQYQVVADDFLVDLYYNLLHNSVKADKSPVVRIDVLVDTADSDRLRIRFEDRAGGIDEGTRRWIMSQTEKLEYRGRGLGLTLVKQIVERYAGSISVSDRVEGVPTDGAVVSVTLPLV